MKEIEELLQPRWKVIADYPGMMFEVGDIVPAYENGVAYILRMDDNTDKYSMIEFPALFRKLQWWEERSIEDMPEYLKWQNNGKVRKVKQYHTGFSPMVVEFEGGRTRKLKSEWTPCTAEEYQSYIESKK